MSITHAVIVGGAIECLYTTPEAARQCARAHRAQLNQEARVFTLLAPLPLVRQKDLWLATLNDDTARACESLAEAAAIDDRPQLLGRAMPVNRGIQQLARDPC